MTVSVARLVSERGAPALILFPFRSSRLSTPASSLGHQSHGNLVDRHQQGNIIVNDIQETELAFLVDSVLQHARIHQTEIQGTASKVGQIVHVSVGSGPHLAIDAIRAPFDHPANGTSGKV